jgi:hypothetical protein
MFHDARLTDLPVPHGKYYLADAGFQICDALLIPYRGEYATILLSGAVLTFGNSLFNKVMV